MMKFLLYVLRVVLVFAITGLAIYDLTSCASAAPRGHGDAIQGLYSHLGCDTQPGTHPWFVNVENHPFFMGCR